MNLEQLQLKMSAYFAAEKWESLLFMVCGLTAVVIAIVLWRSESSYRGMLYPLVIIGLIQVVAGSAVFFRTDAQAGALASQLQVSPADYEKAELARMKIVNRNFAWYKTIEIVLLAAGIGMTYLFRQNDFLYSLAVGLVLESALMLVADLFAEHRAEDYVRAIQTLL